VAADADRQWYERECAQYFERFRELIATTLPDTIIRAASSRDLNAPYFMIARSLFPAARAIDSMVKAPGVSCGTQGATVESVLPSFSFSLLPDDVELGHILLIDDVYSSGCTVGVTIELLRQRGRKFRDVTLAVPLNTNGNVAATAP
jgi:hypothetical protein